MLLPVLLVARHASSDEAADYLFTFRTLPGTELPFLGCYRLNSLVATLILAAGFTEA